MKEKIEAIKQEYLEHGKFANTLQMIDSAERMLATMKRHDSDLEIVVCGMKCAAIEQIENGDFTIMTREIR